MDLSRLPPQRQRRDQPPARHHGRRKNARLPQRRIGNFPQRQSLQNGQITRRCRTQRRDEFGRRLFRFAGEGSCERMISLETRFFVKIGSMWKYGYQTNFEPKDMFLRYQYN